jgi:hypothetical protein
MEHLSRSLNTEVQHLVTEGVVSARSAQEIARLPTDVQVAFALSSSNDFLSKDNITCLVNRYLNKDTGPEERARIIHSPKMALPNEMRQRGRVGTDNSPSARLARAIAGCLDKNAYLTNVLSEPGIVHAAVQTADILALTKSLKGLHAQLLAVFAPGENEGGVRCD